MPTEAEESGALSEKAAAMQRDWLEKFLAALNVFRLYDPDHPKAKEILGPLHEVTEDLQDFNDGEVCLSYSDNTVAVNHFVVDPKVLAFRRLAEDLRQRSVHSLVFSRGVDRTELSLFIQIFSRRPKQIIEGGGLEFLLIEAGVQYIRLARLAYSPRAEPGASVPEKQEDDRILIARMEDCLKGWGPADPGESSTDKSLQLVTLLENPKTTARFLQRKATNEEPDEEFVREVVDTLERAGTIVYTEHPEHWGRTKRNIAEALTHLSQDLRARVLEVIADPTEDTGFLEEFLDSLETDEIATILADSLERNYRRQRPAQRLRKPSPAGTEAKVTPTVLSPLVQKLIQSPEHKRILEPLLKEELEMRGLSKEVFRDLWAPIHPEFNTGARLDHLAPVAPDKERIYQTVPEPDGTVRQGVEDLLHTVNGLAWGRNLLHIRGYIMERETSAEIYRGVLGKQMIEAAEEHLKQGDAEAGRGCLRTILAHAGDAGEAPFPRRQEVAHELLEPLDPEPLTELFLASEDKSSLIDTDLDLLLRVRLENITPMLVHEAFSAKDFPQLRERLLAAMSRNLGCVSDYVDGWLQEGKDPENPALWRVLEEGVCVECVPILRFLMFHSVKEHQTRTIQILGRLGGIEAETALYEKVIEGGPLGELAELQLVKLRSPGAVPLIERRLKKWDLFGSQMEGRINLIEILGEINDPRSRDILRGLMLKRWVFPFFQRHKTLVLSAIEAIPKWPEEEANEVLARLEKHGERAIVMAARRVRAEMGLRDRKEAED